MTLPFALPDWMPWWLPIVLIVPALLYLLALLVMPFAVLGVKSRLDTIDLRLDELQGEIRALSLRMREPGTGRHGPSDRDERPPIPPAPRPDRPADRDGGRAEPRLNWPR